MSAHLPRIKERADLADALKAALGAAYVAHKDHVGELTVTVARDAIVEAARTLRDQFGYQQLMEIAGADYPAAARAVRGQLSLPVADREPPHPPQGRDRRGRRRCRA